MHLHWFGHSCFQMTFSDGTRVIADPFDDHVGYPVPAVETDVATCSHNHGDHGYTQALKGEYTEVRTPEERTFGAVTIDGIESFHDEEQGAKRGSNIIFRYRGDGLTIVHLGDLGHFPTPEQLEFISGADILLCPIGGFYTIDTDFALLTVSMAKPKTVIAMHYKTDAINFPISDEKKFAKALEAQYIPTSDLDVTADTISALPYAIIMDYPKA